MADKYFLYSKFKLYRCASRITSENNGGRDNLPSSGRAQKGARRIERVYTNNRQFLFICKKQVRVTIAPLRAPLRLNASLETQLFYSSRPDASGHSRNFGRLPLIFSSLYIRSQEIFETDFFFPFF